MTTAPETDGGVATPNGVATTGRVPVSQPGPAAVADAVGLVAVALVLFSGRRRTRREGTE